MSCLKIRQILTEDPSAGLSSEVLTHLEVCDACRKFQQDLLNLEELSGLLRDNVSAPSDFASRVVRQTEKRPIWRFGLLSGAAATCLLLIAASVGWHDARKQIQPEVAPVIIQTAGTTPEGIIFKNFAADDPIGVQENGLIAEDYIDLIVESDAGSAYRVRVPSTIKIRRSDLHHDLYLTDVSY
jgi:hypothetical protein